MLEVPQCTISRWHDGIRGSNDGDVQVNQHLASRVFLCAAYVTLADLVVFSALHRPVVSRTVLWAQLSDTYILLPSTWLQAPILL